MEYSPEDFHSGVVMRETSLAGAKPREESKRKCSMDED